jgi:hypothetical protein
MAMTAPPGTRISEEELPSKTKPKRAYECGGEHAVQSLITGYSVDPSTRTLIPECELLCVQCGKPLDDIRKKRKRS